MKRFKTLFLLLTTLSSFFPALLYSHVDTAWVRRYNGPGNGADEACAIAVDGAGNVYVTGYSVGSGTYPNDYATIKYNSAGETLWVRRYDGLGARNDEACAIAVDGVGNVYVTGFSYGANNDYATIKYDSTGVQQWVKRYNGPGNSSDYAKAMVLDGAGNIYVTGQSAGSGTGQDYATIKYTSVGDTLWVRRYNRSGGTEDARAIAVDASGNVYVTGASYSTNRDYTTIKYNLAGVQQWVSIYNGTGDGDDYPEAIAVDGSGNVYVTGHSPDSISDRDYTTIKYNPNGETLWVRRYDGGGNSYDYAYAMAVDGAGNVYVTGRSAVSGTQYDYATIKYDSAGDTLWVRRYGEAGTGDDAYAIAVDGAANVYVTGKIRGGITRDYATIKYNSAGEQQWVATYNGIGNSADEAYAIAVDNLGNVYVTGMSYGSGTDFDYATIKYVQTGAIEENRGPICANCLPIEIYPNPVKGVLRVRGPFSEKTIKIFDITGKMVKEIEILRGVYPEQQNEILRFAQNDPERRVQNDGVRETKISLKRMNPGIYFLQLGKLTKKFIVTK
jgi:uncharacterized delta-60 repeat protein